MTLRWIGWMLLLGIFVGFELSLWQGWFQLAVGGMRESQGAWW